MGALSSQSSDSSAKDGTDLEEPILLACMSPEIIRCAMENDRKHDDLCVGSMGISPMDQQRTS